MFDMEVLLWAAIMVLFFLIKSTKDEIADLKKEFAKLSDQLKKLQSFKNSSPDINPAKQAPQNPSPSSEKLLKENIEFNNQRASYPNQPKLSEPSKQSLKLNNSNFKKTTAETNGFSFLGQNLITWIAGLAAILGAFYFIKYSIDRGLLGPFARMLITVILGFISIFCGIILWDKKDFANHQRISQVLIGSGIAMLYFAAYGAAKIYGFIPLSSSFMLMCIITAFSIFLTIRFGGIPIAILGLIGGFLTPALVGSGNSGVIYLSAYLFVLATAFLFLAKRFASFALIILCLFAIYGWIFIWMLFSYMSYDSGWLMALIVALTAIISFLFPAKENPDWKNLQKMATSIGLFVAFCFLIRTGFGIFEWGIIGLMLSGLVVLSFYDCKTYLPPLSLAFFLSFALFGYSTLVVFSNLSLLNKQLVYLGLACIGFLPFYISLWFKKNREILFFTILFVPLVYGLYYVLFGIHQIYPYIGFGLFLIFCLVIFSFNLNKTEDQKDAGLVVLSATATLTMSLTAYLDVTYWPIVLVLEIMLLGMVNSFTKIQSLSLGIWSLLVIFVLNQHKMFILAAQLFAAGQLQSLKFYTNLLNVDFFVSSIILPVMAFVILAFLSKDKLIKGVFSFLSGFITVFGLFAFYMKITMRFADITAALPSFGEQAFITNVVMLISLGCLYARHKQIFMYVLGLGLWRVIIINLVAVCPLFTKLDLSMLDIFNAYFIPMLVTGILAYCNQGETRKILSWISAGLSFTLVSFIILKANYGTLYLNNLPLSSQGIFVLSMGWLILGCIWLSLAFYNKSLVLPAFGLIYFVIAKVFLYDVSSLDGIYRVAALFGLAGSLLGISHFYTKYFQTTQTLKE